MFYNPHPNKASHVIDIALRMIADGVDDPVGIAKWAANECERLHEEDQKNREEEWKQQQMIVEAMGSHRKA